MPSFSAGDLDRRIALLKTILVPDGLQKVPTPIVFATVWAAVKPVSDGEKLRGGEQQAELVARFTIRWSPKAAEIDPTFLVRYPAVGGPLFGIFGVKEIGFREWFEITATARAEKPA